MTHNAHTKQHGFSLFEMLLTVGIAATFFIFLFNIGQTIAKNQAVKAAASYVQTLEDAVDVIISDPTRFNILFTQVEAAGRIAQASVDDLKDSSGILNTLPNNPLLSASFPDIGPFGQTYRVIFRTLPITAGAPRVIETFIVSETKLDDDILTRVAGAIGGTGGALRDSSAVAGSTIRGTYGGWTMPTNTLLASAWYTAISAQSAPTTANGGYIVSYNYNDSARIARDYLYRINTGDPLENTMYTDLSMGSYNLLGADTVTSTGTMEANELIVEGTTTLANAPTIAGSLQSDGPLATGAISASGGSVQFTGANSDVTINNTTNATRAVFNDTFTTNSHTAAAITTENTAINGGNFIATNTRGINASIGSSAFSVSNNLNVVNQTQASNITTGSLRAINGEVGAIYVESTGALTQNGLSNTTVNTFGGEGRTRSTTRNWTCNNNCDSP